MTLAIEKNIPVPPRKHGKGPGESKWPLAELEIGESFFLPGGTPADLRNVSARGCQIGKRLNRKFTTRRMDGGVRCWRVA